MVKENEVHFEMSRPAENMSSLSKVKFYLHIEKEYWKQKSCMKWFTDGDKNTKFFHAYVKGRRIKLHVKEIQTVNVDVINNPQHIEEESGKVFKEQFKETSEESTFELIQSIPIHRIGE